jgi:hypothetical protein
MYYRKFRHYYYCCYYCYCYYYCCCYYYCYYWKNCFLTHNDWMLLDRTVIDWRNKSLPDWLFDKLIDWHNSLYGDMLFHYSGEDTTRMVVLVVHTG